VAKKRQGVSTALNQRAGGMRLAHFVPAPVLDYKTCRNAEVRYRDARDRAERHCTPTTAAKLAARNIPT